LNRVSGEKGVKSWEESIFVVIFWGRDWKSSARRQSCPFDSWEGFAGTSKEVSNEERVIRLL
jgi:hypothetical protein